MNSLKNNLGNENISFKDIGNSVKNNKLEGSLASKEVKQDIDHLKEFIEGLGNMEDNDTGGCPLIKLDINGLIKSSPKVKWLLKSWSFKPSLNTTYNNNPIYVDFNVSLQTQYVLTDADLTEILC
jgi:hypothetical protein